MSTEQTKPLRVTDRMSVMRMSPPNKEFLKKNPQIAQVAGRVAITVKQLKDMLKEFDGMLSNVDYFASLQESGNRGELEKFLGELNYNLANDAIAIFENLPQGAYEKAVEEMGPEVLQTDVHFS